ncbi:F-box protein GID2-like protein [Cinnamomum micranthum f. kanehirae]|uniref:F-box protein GID2 n=1 Tax=Cinnamomum micranthum f. kanehirae TaxID=337451 RepID=A0A3S3NK76_9MAGN|nr:F-box protein GID2-like protein [Cinnamomum micranthum f. kanehirae]
MKRSLEEDPMIEEKKEKMMKKQKGGGGGGGEEEGDAMEMGTGISHLDEDLLFEVLKHVDARTLGLAACVSKQWWKTAKDERLWEMICTRQSASSGCGNQQLRSVVLALGGFRRLYALYLWPLLKPPPTASSSSSSSTASTAVTVTSLPAFPRDLIPTHWGKDEVHLSLSLLSIRYYEKMNLNLNKRGR